MVNCVDDGGKEKGRRKGESQLLFCSFRALLVVLYDIPDRASASGTKS